MTWESFVVELKEKEKEKEFKKFRKFTVDNERPRVFCKPGKSIFQVSPLLEQNLFEAAVQVQLEDEKASPDGLRKLIGLFPREVSFRTSERFLRKFYGMLGYSPGETKQKMKERMEEEELEEQHLQENPYGLVAHVFPFLGSVNTTEKNRMYIQSKLLERYTEDMDLLHSLAVKHKVLLGVNVRLATGKKGEKKQGPMIEIGHHEI